METPIYPFNIPTSWGKVLGSELDRAYLTELAAFVETERRLNGPIYPPSDLVFSALQQTTFDDVNVVIMGQDPYHGEGQAHGLSFSVPFGVPPPPSLKNIFKELSQDVGTTSPSHGCLLAWAKQGVLLLNATLTVRAGQPKSHYGRGWERFTDALIAALIQRPEPLVFLLWGQSAKEKLQQFQTSHHLVLTSAHPSPFSVTRFYGCKHFSKANAFLKQQGRRPINWQL